MTERGEEGAPAIPARAAVAPVAPSPRAVRKRASRRRTQDERSAESRHRLVEAAAKVLQKRGYAGFRMAEVSRVARISRGGLLHHFPSKDKLLVATAAHLLRASLIRGMARARDPRALADPVEAIIQDSIDFFLGPDFGVILDLVLSSGKKRELRDDVLEHARQSRPAVEAAWLEVLADSGIPRADAEKILWLTVSIVRGLAVRALWQRDERLFRTLLDEWKAIVAGHLAGLRRKTHAN